MNLTTTEIEDLRAKYYYLMNYESVDPNAPIDPLSYIDSNGDTLLHISAQAGDLRTVELLVRAGIDLNQIGDMGCTALHFAKMNNASEVVRFLLDQGASESIRNKFGQLPSEV